ncbi:TRAP transporter small permease subunit [Thioalkalivibrio sp. HK1]|uniref:TRAP transporter small permease subunit n=1 Tax=Thioalkalivibrio sp. HK1 TaxID=1469245 RepID=UPI0004703197|nr:TRAP transporter small permease subunit [Thioalkalivibrio sp. HK1]
MNEATADLPKDDPDLDDRALGDKPRTSSDPKWDALIRLSERLRSAVDAVGRFGSWMIVPLIVITVLDVSIRKVGTFQIMMVETFGRFFNSTVLQELEWHFHTALFALVLGYGYIWNTHVRVDLVREHLHYRRKAWLEFLGLIAFLIPYICIVIYFAAIYAWDSYAMNEISSSTVGLTHRWIIKTVLVTGFAFVLVAGISVLLQIVVVLFGPQNKRFPLMTIEWPEEEGTRIEGKERLDLSTAEDTLRKRATESGHINPVDEAAGKTDNPKGGAG